MVTQHLLKYFEINVDIVKINSGKIIDKPASQDLPDESDAM